MSNMQLILVLFAYLAAFLMLCGIGWMMVYFVAIRQPRRKGGRNARH